MAATDQYGDETPEFGERIPDTREARSLAASGRLPERKPGLPGQTEEPRTQDFELNGKTLVQRENSVVWEGVEYFKNPQPVKKPNEFGPVGNAVMYGLLLAVVSPFIILLWRWVLGL